MKYTATYEGNAYPTNGRVTVSLLDRHTSDDGIVASMSTKIVTLTPTQAREMACKLFEAAVKAETTNG